MVIAIDFDGTIVKHRFPEIGELLPDAKSVINRIYGKHEIIIWTCRELPQHILAMKQFLRDNRINYHKINENSDLVTYGCFPKIYADFYIDDRAIGGIPSWLDIEKIINKRESDGKQ